MGVSSDFIGVLYQLMPGFLASWLFYSLTAHQRDDPFGRVVTALIFSSLIGVLNAAVEFLLLLLGRLLAIGSWNTTAERALAIAIAIPLGIGAALVANNDLFHDWLRRNPVQPNLLPGRSPRELTFTRRTSHPSEWHSAFARFKRFVILHLDDGRRLYGWPEEWPDFPDVGSFVLEDPEWLLDDNSRVRLFNTVRFLVPVQRVWMVEFMRVRGEDPEVAQNDEIEAEAQKLTRLYQKVKSTEVDDGK